MKKKRYLALEADEWRVIINCMLTKKIKVLEGITEKLKAEDQMAWVKAMNNIKNRAEEIAYNKLIHR